jgi:hypothetical protein
MRSEAESAWLEAAPERHRSGLAVHASIHRAPIELIAIGHAAAARLRTGACSFGCRFACSCMFRGQSRGQRRSGKCYRECDSSDGSLGHGKPSQTHSINKVARIITRRQAAVFCNSQLAPCPIGRDTLVRRPHARRQLSGLPKHIDRHPSARMKIAADAEPFWP